MRQPFWSSACKSFSSAGWMLKTISNVCLERCGSSKSFRNSCAFGPNVLPPYWTGPYAPRQLATVVKHLPSRASAVGHSSSTTGGRTRLQEMPQVGMEQAGVPIFSPMVKYLS